MTTITKPMAEDGKVNDLSDGRPPTEARLLFLGFGLFRFQHPGAAND
jgi:hypothetical protein